MTNSEHNTATEALMPATATPGGMPAGEAASSAVPTDSTTAAEPVPIVTRAWRRMRSEPSLLFTVAYLFVSCIGVWANYWFYQGFRLPILEYMQASDYLVAGLRDPAYALVLLVSFVLFALVSVPDLYRRRHPARVDAWRRRWWGKLVFPSSKWLRWKGIGLTPETGAVVAVCWGMLSATLSYVHEKGQLIREGRSGHVVRVTMAGDSAALPHTARLLGSSSAYVFLWWPQSRVAEAVPIESIARLQSVSAIEPTAPVAPPKPAADVTAGAAHAMKAGTRQ